MASINKTDRGTWTVRWRQLNGQGRKRTFPRRVDAEAFRTEIEAGKLRGETINHKLAKTPLADWLTEWEQGRLGRRASTRNRDESLIRNHILPTFGGKTVGGIEPSDVRAWVARLAEDYSSATVRKTYGLLASCLQAAVDDGLISRSPCRSIKLPSLEQRPPRFLDAEEIGRLAETVPIRYRALILIAVFTGLRWGELAGLRVSDLELLQRRLRVNQALSRDRGKLTFGPPKTVASRRTVNVSPNLVEIIADHIRRFPTESGLVFAASGGTVLRDTNFRRRVWAPALADAGLVGLHFHDLRHSHAALLIKAGEHVKVIQSRLGHKSARITLDVYGHLFDGIDEAAADRLDEAISEAVVPVLRPFGEIIELG